MPTRRALIIDRNQAFRDLTLRVLASVGIEVETVDGAKAGLERMAEGPRPAIVMLAVEQPKKRGFAVFTQIKNLDKQVPIAIVTSSVSMEDMLLHQKLRLHADAYLDKRSLDEAQLLRAINGLLGLGLDRDEIADLAEQAARNRKDVTPPGDGSPGLDDDLGATLAALEDLDPESDRGDDDAEELLEVETKPVASEDDPDELSGLREEVERLRAELSSAQRAAGTSPFSPDYLELSNKAGRADRDVARLRAEVERQTAQAEARTDEAKAAERKLIAAARALKNEQDARVELESRVESLQKQLEEASATARDLGARLEAAGQALERTREEQTAEIASAREEFERRFAQELAEAREAHEKTLAEREQQHTQRIAEIRNEREQALEQAAAKAAEERKRELAQASDERLSQLDTAEKKRRSDIEELSTRHRTEIGKVEERWQRELDEERKRHRAELDAQEKRFSSRVMQLEKDKRAAEESAHKQSVKAAEAFDDLLREKQETQKLRASLADELEKLEKRHARELRLIEQEQARALEALADRLHGGEPKEPRRAKSESRDPEAFTDLLESVQTLEEEGEEGRAAREK